MSTMSSGKRLFELKPECYALYSQYFYHYSRSEQVKSEESERKRRKLANDSSPAVLAAPELPEFVGAFKGVLRLLKCDVVLYALRLVLSRSTSKWSKSWSESQLEKVLFLIDVGLNEERADAEFGFLSRLSESGVVGLLETLTSSTNASRGAINEASSSQEFIQYILQKYADIRRAHRGESGSSGETEDDDESCHRSAAETERMAREKQKKADLANRRRERVMAKMAKLQRNFIRENRELFDSTPMEVAHPTSDDAVAPMDSRKSFCLRRSKTKHCAGADVSSDVYPLSGRAGSVTCRSRDGPVRLCAEINGSLGETTRTRHRLARWQGKCHSDRGKQHGR